MQQLRVLQIGDIHYDEAKTGPPPVDVKDEGFDMGLLAAAAPPRLGSVMKAVQLLCEQQIIDAAVFCGDLSSRGALPVYKEAVGYLNSALDLAAERYWSFQQIHAVPGNHDVDRELGKVEDLFAKFDPLVQTWKDEGCDVLAARSERITTIGTEPQSLKAVSLNSAVGSGERRWRSGDLTDEQRKRLEEADRGGDQDAGDALWEELDTPLIYEEHLRAAVQAITGSSAEQLPIVVAHHNLLPQAVPRADIYTELFNGGAARAQFSGQGRWVVYLHGHVHDDPVEIIQQRYPETGNILSVSAPLFTTGFNILTLEFGQMGRPLGATVTRHRYENGGAVRPQSDIRVPLRSSDEIINPLVDRLLDVVERGQIMNFVALRDEVEAAEVELSDACREAEWAGLLWISQREQAPKQWRIGRDPL